MTREAAKTGPGAMVLVAIEQGLPETKRILFDPLAYPILPLSSSFWVGVSLPMRNWIVAKTEQKSPGLWGGIMARKRYIDDVLAEAVGGTVEAVVNLGAGFDTRAFRLPELAVRGRVGGGSAGEYEAKQRRIRAFSVRCPGHVNLVRSISMERISHGSRRKRLCRIDERPFSSGRASRSTDRAWYPVDHGVSRRRLPAAGSPSPTPQGLHRWQGFVRPRKSLPAMG